MTETQTLPTPLPRPHHWLDLVELALTLAVAVAFFYPTPTRDAWVWLAHLYPLIWVTRLTLGQPIFSKILIANAGPLLLWLGLLNMVFAPYPSRGLILLYRPFWGLALVILLTGWALRHRDLRWMWTGTAALGVILAVAGLTATQWDGKASRFGNLTQYLPDTRSFDVWAGGFNPNEIAGALVWVLPLAAGLAVRSTQMTRSARIGWGVMALALGAALFLGQSLSGMVGAAVGLVLVVTPQRLWRWAISAVAVGVVVANLAVFVAPLTSANILADLSGRPSVTSLEHRGVMWARGVAMVWDHPQTGVGMAMYRQLRAEYPTPGFEYALAPHPHNEALHFATDFGVWGLGAWLALYSGATLGLYRAWRIDRLRPAAIAVGAGLAAHAVYGLADAIPVWDRLAFVGWWLQGMAVALGVTATRFGASDTPPTD
ncbi:MAG: O-antigen ligase family protein [Anaerolineae bacterium]|nr:O-antigen ligase family protein [Anaerolineae bacterium]